MWKKIKANPFLRSSLWTVVAFNGANFLSFVANFILVRAISVGDYGEYIAATAYAGLLAIPWSILTLIIIKKIGQRKERERAGYILTLEKKLTRLVKQNWWWMILIGMAIGGGLKYGANLSYNLSIGYVLISLVMSAWGVFWGASLQGMKDFQGFSLAMIGTTVARVLLLLIAIWIFPQALWFVYAAILGSSLAGILWQKARVKKYARQGEKKMEAGGEIKLAMTKEMWVTALGTLGTTALISVDVMLVKKFQTEEIAGLFSLLSLGGKILYYATSPMLQVAFAFGAAHEGEKHQLTNLKISTGIFVVAGMAAIGAYAMLPEFIINILAGEAYLEIANYWWLAGCFGLLYILNNLYTQFLINKRSWWAAGAILMTIVQVVAIGLWHDNLQTVLLLDIGVGIGLLLVNIIGICSVVKSAHAKKSINTIG